MYHLIKIFTLLLILSDYINCECPDPSIILPCTGCQYNRIDCSGHTDIDLIQIFKKLNETLKKDQKHFEKFHFDNTNVTEIKANTTLDITFDVIEIVNSNLIHIDPTAFMDTCHVTTNLIIGTNLQLNTSTVIDVINKFDQATRIMFIGENSTMTLPAEAFKNPKSKLEVLYFILGMGDTLTSGAFRRLDSVRTIHLYNSHIKHIPVNAFAIDVPTSGYQLTIDLSNNSLSAASFEPGAMNSINRQTNLILSKQSEKLTYLPEDVFMPYFMWSRYNVIIKDDNLNEFDCQDCRSAWITNFNSDHIQGVKCTDGRDLYDEHNFANCTKTK
jgi:hypothetical protein